jgi:hypothetical protein
MTDAQWYYAEEGEQQGPVSLAEMIRLVGAKRVKSDDLVWCDGMADWLPAGEVAALNAVKQKPKPVRKAGAPDSKLGSTDSQPAAPESKAKEPKPKAEEAKPESAGPKPASSGHKAKPVAPPVQESPAEDSFPSLGNLEAEDEPDELDDDAVDELAEELFARPKFPAKRPRSFERETRREAARELEVIRETTREVVVMERADAQLSGVMLFLQLICWGLCFLVVLAAAIVYGLHWLSAGSDSSSTLLLGVAVGSYVLGHSAQRCLEILAAIKNK